MTVTNSFSPNFYPLYSYVFGNIYTNLYSTSNTVVVQTISVTNLTGAPFGTAQSTNITTVTKTLTNNISGDFFLIPTNWCGFTVFQKIWEQKIPSFTNSLVATGTTNALLARRNIRKTPFHSTPTASGRFSPVFVSRR